MTGTSSVYDLLGEIVKLTSQLHLQTDAFAGCSAGPNHVETLPDVLTKPKLVFTFPVYPNVLALFIANGAPDSLADELATIHCDRSSDLAQEYTALYEQACTDMRRTGSSSSDSNLRRMAARLQNTFRSTEENWRQEMIDAVRSLPHKAAQAPRSRNSSPSFNQNFLPVLEAFFKENCRPSRADKSYLAKESGMSYRQIHVWFQNRRNRSKKSSPSEDPSQSGQDKSQFISSHDGDTTENDSDSGGIDKMTHPISSRASSVTLVGEEPSFSNTPPPCAFPMCYPPPAEAYLFPCQHGDFSMPAPQWYRTASDRDTSRRLPEVDLTAFIECFKELSLEDASAEPDAATHTSSASAYNVMEPFTIRPFSAPLPSLIRRPLRAVSRHVSVNGATTRRRSRRSIPPTVAPRTCTESQSCSSSEPNKQTCRGKRIARRRTVRTTSSAPCDEETSSFLDEAKRINTSLSTHIPTRGPGVVESPPSATAKLEPKPSFVVDGGVRPSLQRSSSSDSASSSSGLSDALEEETPDLLGDISRPVIAATTSCLEFGFPFVTIPDLTQPFLYEYRHLMPYEARQKPSEEGLMGGLFSFASPLRCS